MYFALDSKLEKSRSSPKAKRRRLGKGRLKKLGGKLSAKISEKVAAILSARSEFMSRRLGLLVIQIISMNSS